MISRDTFVIQFVGLYDAASRVLDRPYDPGQHSRCDLQRGGVLVRRRPTGLLDRELRAIPVGVIRMAVEQHAKLVDPSTISSFISRNCDCGTECVALQLVQRQHRIVARMIGVVAGRPIPHTSVLAQGQVVGDADRFIVGNREIPGSAAAGVQFAPRCAPGTREIDCPSKPNGWCAPSGGMCLCAVPIQFPTVAALPTESHRSTMC